MAKRKHHGKVVHPTGGGAEVRRVRRALDLTQWQLAELADCSQTSIVQAERGRPMQAELLKRIVAALVTASGKGGRLK